uniref:Uncharacterized protein n=1 Tax=Siphoviridae sp. ctGsX68 TaxID=2825417 RepID=A0A8S5UUB4_9CAUD|nr:MAG TPA: hypothetical protein [Siphoviridae sp. ctGsX68]
MGELSIGLIFFYASAICLLIAYKPDRIQRPIWGAIFMYPFI